MTTSPFPAHIRPPVFLYILRWITFSGGVLMATAKVFMSGGSQAIRLPKAFRVEAGELRIRRQGAALILEPVEEDEWAWLAALRPVDDDYVAAIRAARGGQQSRPGLDEAFP